MRRCKDKAFKSWLGRRYDDYTQKKDPIPPDAKEFMKEVETYYKDRVKTGEWGKLDEDEERIIALRAELAAAKTSTKRDTRRRGDRTTRDNERKERWRTKAPKPNEPNTKRMSVNGTENTYHWCSNHKMWTVHKP